MARATSSFPVPVSPWITTVASQRENFLVNSRAYRNAGDCPTRLRSPKSSMLYSQVVATAALSHNIVATGSDPYRCFRLPLSWRIAAFILNLFIWRQHLSNPTGVSGSGPRRVRRRRGPRGEADTGGYNLLRFGNNLPTIFCVCEGGGRGPPVRGGAPNAEKVS